LYGLGLYPRNLEVAGLGLEQAFVAITAAEEANPRPCPLPYPRSIRCASYRRAADERSTGGNR
ncbi:hypothetical protein AB0N19_14260, partial [Streptomyces sp. NPDC051132]